MKYVASAIIAGAGVLEALLVPGKPARAASLVTPDAASMSISAWAYTTGAGAAQDTKA